MAARRIFQIIHEFACNYFYSVMELIRLLESASCLGQQNIHSFLKRPC